jgi:hypothetical protein
MEDHLAAFRRIATPPRRSVVELIGGGVLDAELAALAWILVEARLPLIVAGMARSAGKTTLLEALLDFLPSAIRRIDLAGVDETFDWLPEAERLGWPSATARPGQPPGDGIRPVSPSSTILVAGELSEHLPVYTGGVAARTFVRAASIGYGIAATIHGDRLEDVHDELRASPIGLSDDELSYLGLVLIIRPERGTDGQVRRRVVAAHYERPVGRDEHGHVQRLPPAVVAVRDERTDRLDHFAWGVMPELGIRLGRTAGVVERDQAARAALLRELQREGVIDVATVAREIRAYRSTTDRGHPSRGLN